MRSLNFVLLLIAFILPLKALPQMALSPDAKISLLTCGPGNELYSVFGHTAVRVYDPSRGIDVVYNYGMFDFDTPNFYLKFVKGDLQYFVGADSYQDFVYTYRYYNRDVYEQFLNLTPQQKQDIATHLNNSLASGETYTYKFIDRNCTTMVGDIFAQYIPVGIAQQNTDRGKTNRTIIQEKLHNKFYESFGINLMFGYLTDREQYKLFLPQHLLEGVANTKTANGPLAQPAQTVFKSTQQESFSWLNNYYTFALAMLFIMWLSRYRIVAQAYLALTGLLGILFCTVGYYSLHAEVTQNYSALLCNPFFLAVLFFIFTKKEKAVKATIYVCFAFIAAYTVMLLNKPHFIMMLPLIAATVVVLIRELHVLRKSGNRQPTTINPA